MLSLRKQLKKNFFFEKNWEKFEKKIIRDHRAGPGSQITTMSFLEFGYKQSADCLVYVGSLLKGPALF